MLNLLAITLLAVIVKNPGMMQNINGAIDNEYDHVSSKTFVESLVQTEI